MYSVKKNKVTHPYFFLPLTNLLSIPIMKNQPNNILESQIEDFNFWSSNQSDTLNWNKMLKKHPEAAAGEDFSNYWNFRVNVEKEAELHNWENCASPFSKSRGFLFEGDSVHPAFVIYFQDRLYEEHWPPKNNAIHQEDFDYFWDDFEGEYDSLVDYVYSYWEEVSSEEIDENHYLYNFLDADGGIDWNGVANDLFNWTDVYVYEAPNNGVYVFRIK